MSKLVKIQLKSIISKFDKKLEVIIKEDLPILKEIKKKVIESGGKRIRPLTHYFFSQMLGYKGNDWLDIGSIAELIHAASLLHDDVIDGAEVRRGKPTIGVLFGNKTAILAGDYLLACGIDHLNSLQKPKILSIYTRVIRDLSVGELIQMHWEKNPKITRKEYDQIIYGKTASLFGAVTEAAGELAEVDSTQLKRLHQFGVDMGMMFQIKDDYIDYFQSSENSGKVQMKDFLNGLFTYPIISLKESMNRSEQKEVEKIFALPKRNLGHISRIHELLYKYDTRKKILNELDILAERLIHFLNSFEKSELREIMVSKIQELVSE